MKTHALYLPFFALLCSTLSSMGGVQASPSAVDSVHFCLNDSEHWSRDRARRPAAKRLADLNVGKPRTVRMIYFLPNDRSFRADVDADAPGLLVKPDIARQQLDAERAQPPSGGEVAGAGTGGESPVPGGGSGSGEVPAGTPPVPRPTRFHGTATRAGLRTR